MATKKSNKVEEEKINKLENHLKPEWCPDCKKYIQPFFSELVTEDKISWSISCAECGFLFEED